VDAFLRFTDRKPDEVLRAIPQEGREASILSIAITGVMAGCRPEYMPILVALVEAMADPQYGVEHSGNTPGAETLIVLNGPLIKQLGFNYEQGALRDGFQPNTSIGRFWRLYLRNVAGFLHHRTDKGTFGNTWRVVLAENEDALRRIGWSTIAEDEGVRGGNAVTISRYTGGGVIASVFGNTPDRMLPYLADSILRKVGWELMFTVGMGVGSQRPLLLLSPILAETLAKGGLDKAALKQRLFELVRMPAWQFERYIGDWTNLVPGRPSLAGLVKAGLIPPVFAESEDPDRLVVYGGSGKAARQQLDRRKIKPCLAAGDCSLKVPRQPPIAAKPGRGALDDLHLEQGGVEARDDNERRPCRLGRVGERCDRRVRAEKEDPPGVRAQDEGEREQGDVVHLAGCTGEKSKRARSSAPEPGKPKQPAADEVAREVLLADLDLAPLPAVADLLQGG
jgi:hypothetical protein